MHFLIGNPNHAWNFPLCGSSSTKTTWEELPANKHESQRKFGTVWERSKITSPPPKKLLTLPLWYRVALQQSFIERSCQFEVSRFSKACQGLFGSSFPKVQLSWFIRMQEIWNQNSWKYFEVWNNSKLSGWRILWLFLEFLVTIKASMPALSAHLRDTRYKYLLCSSSKITTKA